MTRRVYALAYDEAEVTNVVEEVKMVAINSKSNILLFILDLIPLHINYITSLLISIK